MFRVVWRKQTRLRPAPSAPVSAHCSSLRVTARAHSLHPHPLTSQNREVRFGETEAEGAGDLAGVTG